MLNILSTELTEIAQKIRRTSVKIYHGHTAIGSGVIWRSDGLIITNAHVATSRQLIVELEDGSKFNGVRIHIDPIADLAAVRIVATDLESVRTIDRPPLRIGEIVFAVGNPLGDSHAITTGIISQLQPQTIVSDLQLFPGNSGGAMTDCQGNIVGINTAIAAGLAIARSTESVTNFLNVGKPMFI